MGGWEGSLPLTWAGSPSRARKRCDGGSRRAPRAEAKSGFRRSRRPARRWKRAFSMGLRGVPRADRGDTLGRATEAEPRCRRRSPGRNPKGGERPVHRPSLASSVFTCCHACGSGLRAHDAEECAGRREWNARHAALMGWATTPPAGHKGGTHLRSKSCASSRSPSARRDGLEAGVMKGVPCHRVRPRVWRVRWAFWMGSFFADRRGGSGEGIARG